MKIIHDEKEDILSKVISVEMTVEEFLILLGALGCSNGDKAIDALRKVYHPTTFKPMFSSELISKLEKNISYKDSKLYSEMKIQIKDVLKG